jgi:uncharacterized SAM-binding protein YcdF (DUF218 family)
MKRAMGCFEKEGIQPIPFPGDFYATEEVDNPLYYFIPTAEALIKWKIVLHEWLGIVAYKCMGYL